MARNGSHCSSGLLLVPIVSYCLLAALLAPYCLLLSLRCSLAPIMLSTSAAVVPLREGPSYRSVASISASLAPIVPSTSAAVVPLREGPSYRSQFGYYRRCWSQPPQSRSKLFQSKPLWFDSKFNCLHSLLLLTPSSYWTSVGKGCVQVVNLIAYCTLKLSSILLGPLNSHSNKW